MVATNPGADKVAAAVSRVGISARQAVLLQGERAAPLRPWRRRGQNGRMSTTVSPDEVQMSAIRAQGAGGQNVNKVSSAVHLRFDVRASSLPEPVKQRLLALNDQRLTDEGVVVIKAQQFRSQDMNRADALARLQALVDSVATTPRVRRPTKPTRASTRRRLEGKSVRSATKALRGKPHAD